MRVALERQQVVLAHAHQLDVADQDQFLVVRLEGGGEHVRRLHPQAGEEFGVRPGHPRRSALEAVTVRILTDRDEDLPDRLLDTGEVDGLLDG